MLINFVSVSSRFSQWKLKSPIIIRWPFDVEFSVKKLSNSSKNCAFVRPFAVDGGGRYITKSRMWAEFNVIKTSSDSKLEQEYGVFFSTLRLSLYSNPTPPPLLFGRGTWIKLYPSGKKGGWQSLLNQVSVMDKASISFSKTKSLISSHLFVIDLALSRQNVGWSLFNLFIGSCLKYSSLQLLLFFL